MIVARVENLYDIFCQIFLLYRFVIFSLIKQVQTEICDRFCIPDSQSIDNLVVISNNRHIVRNRHNRLISFLYKMISSCRRIVNHPHITAEFYFFCVFRAAQLKRISILQPVIRHFYLITIFNLLFKQTIVVTDTAAICAISQCCQRIKKTCCQSSQTTVSQRRVRLLILDHIQIKSQLFQSFFYFFIRCQVDQIISQSSSHQKFHGQIVYNLRIILLVLFLC